MLSQENDWTKFIKEIAAKPKDQVEIAGKLCLLSQELAAEALKQLQTFSEFTVDLLKRYLDYVNAKHVCIHLLK